MLRAYLKKRKEFNRIVREIKSVQIQGARNIAKAALYTYSLFPDDKHKKIRKYTNNKITLLLI